MEVFLDCLSCTLRQALEASRMATEDTGLQNKIMMETLGILKNYRSYSCSPDVCRAVHGVIKKYTGVYDPYKAVKEKDTRTAFALLPGIKRFVAGKEESLYWALKAAATGNILDSAVSSGAGFKDNAEAELQKPFSICDIEIFESRLRGAKSLLIIGDNAGEAVLDSILMKELSGLDITYAVRNTPIINDVTEEEALASGIEEYARIISSGSDIPGTLLGECSDEFLEIFNNADMVISKGQGNYETLSGCKREIFFLLKVKCSVLSRLLGVGLNEYIFLHEE